MKVLMVGPKICTPWSEGRKKFFRDLCQVTTERWDVLAFITVNEGETADLPVKTEEHICRSGSQHLIHIRRHLRHAIRMHQPDLVCHLPFGVFSGLRGLANIWSIRYVERLCRRQSIPCCTLMYSLTNDADTWFHRFALKNAYLNQHSAAQRTVRFGVNLPAIDPVFLAREASDEKCILFMSGEAVESDDSFKYVMDVRGLRLLLRAGEELQKRGYRLIVAVPFLQNKRLRRRVASSNDNYWAPGSIEYLDKISLPKIFDRARLFAFPYGNEEVQFVPTSIIEAMHFGVPVVLPKLNFLAPFYESEGRCLPYNSGDIGSFYDAIDAARDTDFLNSIRKQASKYIEEEYNILNSVNDLEQIYRDRANAYRN